MEGEGREVEDAIELACFNRVINLVLDGALLTGFVSVVVQRRLGEVAVHRALLVGYSLVEGVEEVGVVVDGHLVEVAVVHHVAGSL